MNSEMLDMWDALKDAKYRRTLEELSSVLEEKRSDFDAAMRGVLNIVSGTMHAEAGTLWQFSRQDGLIRPKASYGGSALADIYLVPIPENVRLSSPVLPPPFATIPYFSHC